jgi:hypothetical protein
MDHPPDASGEQSVRMSVERPALQYSATPQSLLCQGPRFQTQQNSVETSLWSDPRPYENCAAPVVSSDGMSRRLLSAMFSERSGSSTRARWQMTMRGMSLQQARGVFGDTALRGILHSRCLLVRIFNRKSPNSIHHEKRFWRRKFFSATFTLLLVTRPAGTPARSGPVKNLRRLRSANKCNWT